jgi:hypothetical protein
MNVAIFIVPAVGHKDECCNPCSAGRAWVVRMVW